MKGKSKIFISKNREIGEIIENLFGGFLEHVGRAIYTGIYEPEHPTSDAKMTLKGYSFHVLHYVEA